MKASFTSDTVTINGTTHQAGYSVPPCNKDKAVYVFVKQDGKSTRITFKPGQEFYAEALAAAEGVTIGEAMQAEVDHIASMIDAMPEQQSERKADARPAKTERERIEAAGWIGTTIKGKGWEIYFDLACDRTRVIFKKPPTPGVKELVKEFGFYWSPTMKSWNKGLNHKAHRAAEKLAAHLRYYPNKPMFA